MDFKIGTKMSHGVIFIALISLLSFFIACTEWCKSLSLSSMIVGILLGMIFANTVRWKMPEQMGAGIKFCSKRILRLGIILYGFRLTLSDVANVGLVSILIDAVIVCGTIFIGLVVGRMLKMDKEITLLTSCGSAICGAAAVLGVEGTLNAKSYKTAVAVSTVVIFGTIAMFIYPALFRAGAFCLTDNAMGIYTGSTVHEVAHVVGAGNAMNEEVASISIIVKMIRVMMLVPVLLVLAFCVKKESDGSKSKIVIPWFAILFLVVIVFNSVVSLPSMVTETLNYTSNFCLTMAMTALGVETTIDKFRQAGAKPFILAFILFCWLMIGGWLMAKFLVPIL